VIDIEELLTQHLHHRAAHAQPIPARDRLDTAFTHPHHRSSRSIDELADDRSPLRPAQQARRSPRRAMWPALALAAAACIAVVAVVAERSDPGERQDLVPAATEPDRTNPGIAAEPPALVLPHLPDGWVLLDAYESSGPGDFGDNVAIYTRDDPAAKIELHYQPVAAAKTANQTPFTLSDGFGSWNPVSSMSRSGVGFDIVRGSTYVSGQGWGIDATPEAVTALAEQISVDPGGLPVLDPGSGFELRGAAHGATSSVNRALRYGRPDDPDSMLTFTASRADGQLDAELSAGAFADPVDFDGRVLWAEPQGNQITWTVGADRFSVYGRPGFDVVAVAESVQPVSSEAMEAEVGRIGADAAVVDTSRIQLNGRTLTFDRRDQGGQTFVCLTENDATACRSTGIAL
jgi:hypothetical protein